MEPSATKVSDLLAQVTDRETFFRFVQALHLKRCKAWLATPIGAAMTLQDFQRLLKTKPFQPFRMITSSGERYEVRHPEMAFLLRTKIMLGLDPDNSGLADDWTMISLLHVTAIEPVSTQKRKRSA